MASLGSRKKQLGDDYVTSSELYHGFGLEGYRTLATYYEKRRMILKVESTRPLRSACCKSTNVICRGRYPRDFKTLPIGDRL